MENLIADLIQFFSAIAKLLLLQGRLGTRLCVHLKFLIFWVVWQLVRYLVRSVYSDNDLVLFHLGWKETRLTNKKCLKLLGIELRDCSSSEVGSV